MTTKYAYRAKHSHPLPFHLAHQFMHPFCHSRFAAIFGICYLSRGLYFGMTSRKERPPSGRNNLNSARGPSDHDFGTSNAQRNNNQNDSGRKQNSARPSTSGGFRTDRSELSVNEVLRRMRETNDVEKNNRMTQEIRALGEYNSYSRPKSSSVRFVGLPNPIP